MKEFKLDNEPKIITGFTTPDAYFETFASKVIARMPDEQHKVIPLFSRKKTWIIAAAAVFIIALTVPVLNIYNSRIAAPDTAALENYLATHASDDEISELLEVEDLQNIKISPQIEDKVIEDLLSSDSNLEQYIVD
jgi:hypothetical protein